MSGEPVGICEEVVGAIEKKMCTSCPSNTSCQSLFKEGEYLAMFRCLNSYTGELNDPNFTPCEVCMDVHEALCSECKDLRSCHPLEDDGESTAVNHEKMITCINKKFGTDAWPLETKQNVLGLRS